MASMRSALAGQRTGIRSHVAQPPERSMERWMSPEDFARLEAASPFSHPDVHTPVKPPEGAKPIGSPFEIPSSLPTDGPTSPKEEV